MLTRRPYRSIIAAVIALSACTRADDAASNPPSPQNAVQAAMAAASGKKVENIEPVPAADLRKRFPESVAGLARLDDAGGGTELTMGIGISMAQAKYADGARRLSISITDIGSMSQVLAAQAPWLNGDFDRVTPAGYSRTVRIGGERGIESLSKERGRTQAELSVVVGNRFIVNLKGTGLEMSDLAAAYEKLDTRSLPKAR